MRIAATIVWCLILFSSKTYAADPVIVNCVETPSIKSDVELPEGFNLSNNLARGAGSFVRADGELIYIVGRVTDAHCRPVSNAGVFVWHADSRGKYYGEEGYDESFLGSGKAQTDNLGKFMFVTVIPGNASGKDPLVHFLVRHQAFEDFQTGMFFEDFGSNEDDNLSRIPNGIRRILTAKHVGSEDRTRVYEFNITLPPDHEDFIESKHGESQN